LWPATAPISFLFNHNLPVLIEPVVNLGLGVKRIAEVGGTGRSNPVHRSVSGEDVVSQLLVLSVVVVLHNAEVTGGLAYIRKAAC